MSYKYPKEYWQHLDKNDYAIKKWEPTGLLSGLNELQAKKLARVLETQKSYVAGQTSIDFDEMERFIWPIIAKTYQKLFEDNVVDIQPMSLPCDLVFFREVGQEKTEFKSKELAALTRRLKFKPLVDGPNITISIDQYETEIVNLLAEQFYMDIRCEFNSDLMNMSKRIDVPANAFIDAVKNILTRDLDGTKPNFIITSPEINLFLEQANVETRIMVDPFFYRNVVLIGHKEDNDLPRGYVFCPYTSFLLTTTIMNSNTFHVDKRLMSRYAKYMGDKRLYTSVVLKNDNK